jgi:hypothetical protein
MVKFIEILSKVFREENVPVKFKSNLIEQFDQVFDDLGAAQLSKHFAYATDYESLHNEWREKRVEIYSFQLKDLHNHEGSKHWLDTITQFEKINDMSRDEIFEINVNPIQPRAELLSTMWIINRLYFRRHCLGDHTVRNQLQNLLPTIKTSGVLLIIGDRFLKQIIEALR